MKTRSFRSWGAIVIIFSMLVLMVCSVMKIDITNVLTPILQEQNGWDRTTINTAVSIGGYIAILLGFLGATLALKKGIKIVSLIGLAGMAVTCFIMAFSQSITWVCVAYAMGQAFYPLCLLSAITYVSRWYMKRRGWALGIATAALPITSTLYLSVGADLIAATGKTGFYLVFGIVVILIGIMEIVVMKESPEVLGLTPDGIPISADEQAKIDAKRMEVGTFTVKKMLSHKEGWFLLFANCLCRFMMVCLMSQMVSRMTDVGWDRPVAAKYMALATLIGIATSYLWGILDDKITTPKACCIFGVTYVAGFIFVLFNKPGTTVLLILVIAFLASTSGGQQNLITSIVAYVYGRENYVAADRILSVTSNIASAFAYTFMTAIYASTGSYNVAYIILAVMGAATAILYGLIRKTYDPERLVMLDQKKNAAAK